ncbi:MAG: polyketide cyclase [Chryseobacterium sp. SCN 40-13]|nr:MAG: polyketide cyclase [Chryseobacterium sp. SCN 40-13]
MRWFRFGLFFVILLLGIYAVFMYYVVDESKSFTIEKEINYPIDKIYPQFNNLQDFTKWNHYFSSKTLSLVYYRPYEGKGAAVSFSDEKTEKKGELTIRYHHSNHSIRYQLFEGNNNHPTLIDVKFKAISPDRTKIQWKIHTPKQSVMNRVSHLWSEDKFAEDIDKSMASLKNLMSNKVERDQFLTGIKYDSIVVEQHETQLLVGINVSASNRKDALYKNIVLNHNKVYNFITTDLDRNEDEFGFPVLITDPDNFRDKEVSYFIGMPLSRKITISDNNFSYRQIPPSQVYSLYYKGSYDNRKKSIDQLLQKARKDTLIGGDIYQVFLEAPQEGKDVLMKLTLPVRR